MSKKMILSRVRNDLEKNRLLYLVIFLGLLSKLWLIINYPLIDLGNDEGLVLIKSQLLSQGYGLYTEIWNDHPPMMTYFVTGILYVFGNQTLIVRISCLFLNTLITIYLGKALLNFMKKEIVAVAVAFLLLTAGYSILEVSILRGLPCISFAVISFYLLMSALTKTENTLYLLSSGMMLAISLHFKLMTAYLVPTLFIYTLFMMGLSKKAVWTLVIWSFGFSFIFISLVFVSGLAEAPDQIFSHFNGELRNQHSTTRSLTRISKFYSDNWIVTILAIISILRWKKSNTTFAWLILLITSAVLISHHPVRAHYAPLITIPLVVLAAEGYNGILSTVKIKAFWPSLALIVIISLINFKSDFKVFAERRKMDEKLLKEIIKTNNTDDVIVTDLPRYAFEAGLGVPPEIAVMSGKRFKTGTLNSDSIFNIIMTHNPNSILLKRLRNKGFYDQKLDSLISHRYNETTIKHYMIKKKF